MANPNVPTWVTQLFTWLGFARYYATQPTLADQDVTELQCDAAGNLRVSDVFGQPPAGTVAVSISGADQNFSPPLRAVWVGGAGNLALELVNDSAPQTLNAVPAGTLVPGQIKTIKAAGSGTTATLIVGLR